MPNKETAVTLQKVTAETMQDFLGLIDKLAEYEHLPHPDEEAKERLRRDCLATNPRYHAYIGAVNGRPVAYVIYFFTYSSFLALPTLFLEDIFVFEEYRRQGAGSKMFAFMKEVARQEGCGSIEFSVLKWNRSAQAFYERNGARCLEWCLYRLVREDF
jgi:GNAT superfamily N-acetyltransferase